MTLYRLCYFFLTLSGFPRCAWFSPQEAAGAGHALLCARSPSLAPLPLVVPFLPPSPQPPGLLRARLSSARAAWRRRSSGRASLCLASAGAERWSPAEPCLAVAPEGWTWLDRLDGQLEIWFCCQEICKCNRPNISRKQTKSCWFWLYCCLFTDWNCQEQSSTIPCSMPVPQILDWGRFFRFHSARLNLLVLAVSRSQQVKEYRLNVGPEGDFKRPPTPWDPADISVNQHVG